MKNKSIRPRFGISPIRRVLEQYDYHVSQEDILVGEQIGTERCYDLVDLGLDRISCLPRQENLGFFSQEPTNRPKQLREFLVVSVWFSSLKTTISVQKLNYLRLFDQLKKLDWKKLFLLTQVDRKIRRGRLVRFDQLRILIPNSHLSKFYKRVRPYPLISQRIPIKLLEIRIQRRKEETMKNLVLGSLRLSLFPKDLWPLQVGAILIGTILKIKRYGIFVNLAGLKCLLHRSELDRPKGSNLYESFQPGQRMRVRILYINQSEARIFLSEKNLDYKES